MSVTEIASTQQNAASRQATTATETGLGSSSDFQTFLTMLTTQLQNQDPLNPLESTDFAVQLATFSGVEQQVKTNDLLEGLGTRLNVMALSDLVGWVGLNAEAEGPVWFSGSPIELGVSTDPSSDAELLSIYNASNKLVAQEQVPAGSSSITWAGTDTAGKPLPEGAYHFVLDHMTGGIVTGSSPVTSFSPIIEARNDEGTVILIREGGLPVAASEVTALRSPNAS